MKGVRFITDTNNKRVGVQIDMKTLSEYEKEIEDLLDIIIAESRRDEEKIPISEVKRQLKKAGKL